MTILVFKWFSSKVLWPSSKVIHPVMPVLCFDVMPCSVTMLTDKKTCPRKLLVYLLSFLKFFVLNYSTFLLCYWLCALLITYRARLTHTYALIGSYGFNHVQLSKLNKGHEGGFTVACDLPAAVLLFLNLVSWFQRPPNSPTRGLFVNTLKEICLSLHTKRHPSCAISHKADALRFFVRVFRPITGPITDLSLVFNMHC